MLVGCCVHSVPVPSSVEQFPVLTTGDCSFGPLCIIYRHFRKATGRCANAAATGGGV